MPNDILGINKWPYPKAGNYDGMLLQVLERLGDACTPVDGIPPILKFVKQLALCAVTQTKDLQDKLQHWIGEFANVGDINPHEIAQLRTELEALHTQPATSVDFPPGPRSLSPSLLIKL